MLFVLLLNSCELVGVGVGNDIGLGALDTSLSGRVCSIKSIFFIFHVLQIEWFFMNLIGMGFLFFALKRIGKVPRTI